MASKERISAGDKALWLLGTAVTIALLLIAPKLSADITGRWATGLLLLSMFVLFVLALWYLHWFHYRKILFCIGIVVVGALTSALGLWVWPYTLEVTPKQVSFETFIPHVVPNERYSFRLLNRSDDDVYAAEFDFIVDDPNGFVRDFTIDIPKDSRKPSGEGGAGAEHFVDIVGLACRDLPKHRPLYILSLRRLAPHESREITITHTGSEKSVVLAKTGFFSTEPQPQSVNGNIVGSTFRFSTPVDSGGCMLFGFLVDEREHQGMYWFNHKDGLYSGRYERSPMPQQ